MEEDEGKSRDELNTSKISFLLPSKKYGKIDDVIKQVWKIHG